VVVCDIVMPRMRGDMFYYAVQRVKPALCERFIFITALGEYSRTQEFLNQVSGMVLLKPFHLDDLLEAILLLFRELDSPTNNLVVPAAPVLAAPLPPADEPRLGPCA
jgi:two-component SAPR family response regulator